MPINIHLSDGPDSHANIAVSHAWGAKDRGRAKNTNKTWELFGKRLRRLKESPETMAAYDALTKEEQGVLKATAGFIYGAPLKDGIRRRGHALPRRIISLDLDNVSSETVDRLLSGTHSASEYEFKMHSTRGDRPWLRKMRLFFLAEAEITEDDYPAIARIFALQIFGHDGMAQIDPASFRPMQLMYWPSCSSDQELLFHHNRGRLVDADAQAFAWGVLEHFDGSAWRNHALLPTVPGETAPRRAAERAADPRLKPGIVGAFCRVFSIEDAIVEFDLPYEPMDGVPGRYTYTGGTTMGAAIVYGNGTFLYSHHRSDPAGGQLCNAFDLVRIHLFGHLDLEADA